MLRLHEGVELGDRYRLVSPIASGGMGDVWRADDTILRRSVAAKIMRAPTEDQRDFLTRFRNEARHAAGLSHPNIAVVFDYGEFEDLSYLIMELVEGESLSSALKREGKVDHPIVRSLLSQAALAVAAAHDARVIHRDIKPANVLLGDNGQVKLTDFGIARALDAAGPTRTGEMVGTPHYTAPEVALGRQATEASDIYALGVIGYELVSGHRPYERDTPVATLLASTRDPLPPLPQDVPEELRQVIERCLAKDPGHRPASARDIARALGVVEASSQWTDVASAPARAARSAETESTPSWSMPSLVGPLDGWVTPQQQSRDLEELLATLDPRLHEGEYAIVSVREVPEGAQPYMSLLEPEGITMLLTVTQAQELGLDFELPLSWITLGAYRAIGTRAMCRP